MQFNCMRGKFKIKYLRDVVDEGVVDDEKDAPQNDAPDAAIGAGDARGRRGRRVRTVGGPDLGWARAPRPARAPRRK